MTTPEEPWTPADEVVRQAHQIANRLRGTADEIVRAATRNIAGVGQPGTPNYATVAASVMNAYRALLGNVHIDGLILAAADADTARSRRIAADTIADKITASGTAVVVKSDADHGYAQGHAAAARIARDHGTGGR